MKKHLCIVLIIKLIDNKLNRCIYDGTNSSHFSLTLRLALKSNEIKAGSVKEFLLSYPYAISYPLCVLNFLMLPARLTKPYVSRKSLPLIANISGQSE
jgi:hypothetical protein